MELSSHLDFADISFISNDGKLVCECSNCSKSNQVFSNRYRLVRDMLTGEKPDACDICSKTSAGQENLKIHKRINTGEKPSYSNKLIENKNRLSILHSWKDPRISELGQSNL